MNYKHVSPRVLGYQRVWDIMEVDSMEFMYKLEGGPTSPKLNHICVWLGPAPPTPPALPCLLAHTCAGTLPGWEPM